jgi:2-(1,2-epoxy-1,2-dihydrophenyl)acetyl-CoA isomerase
MEKHVLLSKQGSWEKITLNRPNNLNALNEPMLEQLYAAFDELENDAHCRAILLTGAGVPESV